MIMLGLAVIAFVVIFALIIGAIYWFLWITVAICVIVAIVSHIKYLEWQKAVPSSTKCPECGASMLVKTVNSGTSGIAAGKMFVSGVGVGTSSTQNYYGQLMVCKVCGHQEYRLTRQTINYMTQKYKNRRTLFIILFVISLVAATMFSQSIFNDDSTSSDTTNQDMATVENSQEKSATKETDSSVSIENEEMKTFSFYDGFLTAILPARWNFDETTDSLLYAYPSGSVDGEETFGAFYGDLEDNYDDIDIEEQLKIIGESFKINDDESSNDINDFKQEILENDSFGLILKQSYVKEYASDGNSIARQHEEYYCPINNNGLFGILFLDYGFNADKEPKYENDFYNIFVPGIKINGIENIRIEKDSNIETDSTKKEDSDPTVEEPDEENAEVSIQEALGEELYSHVRAVLIDEIGFTEVDFIRRQGENDNYEFNCDGRMIMVTAFTDEEGEYIRIFEPHTDNVFYEDGQLLMTKTDLDDDTSDESTNDNAISSEDTIVYQIIAEEIVRNCMKDPSSAKFPSAVLSDDWAYGKKGDLIAVKSYVDGINSFGASVRSEFFVEFYITDKDTFSYEIQYIRIGNDEQGEYIDVS